MKIILMCICFFLHFFIYKKVIVICSKPTELTTTGVGAAETVSTCDIIFIFLTRMGEVLALHRGSFMYSRGDLKIYLFSKREIK
jgi:hypothetical protein